MNSTLSTIFISLLGCIASTILLFILFSTIAYADPADSWGDIRKEDQKEQQKNHEHQAKLILKPNLCVVKHKGEFCQQNIKVSYQSPWQNNVCLYYSLSDEPIWCDKKIKQVELRIQIESNESIELFAKDTDNNILARATFALSIFQPAKERKRRRYGLGIL